MPFVPFDEFTSSFFNPFESKGDELFSLSSLPCIRKRHARGKQRVSNELLRANLFTHLHFVNFQTSQARFKGQWTLFVGGRSSKDVLDHFHAQPAGGIAWAKRDKKKLEFNDLATRLLSNITSKCQSSCCRCVGASCRCCLAWTTSAAPSTIRPDVPSTTSGVRYFRASAEAPAGRCS